jgi:hypothetical protein
MSHLAQHYGPAAGPLGFPMTDRAARTLDTLLKSLPKSKEYEYRHLVSTRAPTELNPGERSDVSWISTESVDRTGEVVLARGMNDAQFQANPLVTLGHAYWLPPVGKSLWRKRGRDGSLVGVKAKTQYPARPAAWPDGEPWPPDKVLALIQAGLLQGKSIGFLPTRVHVPDERERQKNGWDDVSLVIDEWLLLEYACVFLPANQDSLVEAVSKGGADIPPEFLRALGLDLSSAPPAERVVPFTALEEIERHVERRIAAVDWEALARRAVEDSWHKACGRV